MNRYPFTIIGSLLAFGSLWSALKAEVQQQQQVSSSFALFGTAPPPAMLASPSQPMQFTPVPGLGYNPAGTVINDQDTISVTITQQDASPVAQPSPSTPLATLYNLLSSPVVRILFNLWPVLVWLLAAFRRSVPRFVELASAFNDEYGMDLSDMDVPDTELPGMDQPDTDLSDVDDDEDRNQDQLTRPEHAQSAVIDEVRELEHDASRLKDRIEDIQNNINYLQKDLDHLSGRLDVIDIDIKKGTSRLKDKVEDIQNNVDYLQKNLNNLSGHMKTIDIDQACVERKLRDIDLKVDEDVDTLEANFESCINEARKFSNQITRKEQELSEAVDKKLKEFSNSVDQALADFKVRFESQQAALARASTQAIENAVAEAHNRINSSRAQQQGASQAINDFSTRMHEVESRLIDTTKDLQNMCDVHHNLAASSKKDLDAALAKAHDILEQDFASCRCGMLSEVDAELLALANVPTSSDGDEQSEHEAIGDDSPNDSPGAAVGPSNDSPTVPAAPESETPFISGVSRPTSSAIPSSFRLSDAVSASDRRLPDLLPRIDEASEPSNIADNAPPSFLSAPAAPNRPLSPTTAATASSSPDDDDSDSDLPLTEVGGKSMFVIKTKRAGRWAKARAAKRLAEQQAAAADEEENEEEADDDDEARDVDSAESKD